ncbi:MAG: DUF202 domain-containing protein [Cellulomonas sp.]
MPEAVNGRDPGLQPERTGLAWQRTAVAATGVCLVAAATAARTGMPVLLIPASTLALGTFISVVHHPRGVGRKVGWDVWPSLLRTVVVVAAVAVIGVVLAANRIAQLLG